MSKVKSNSAPVRFIDLFAGIGGFHIAMHAQEAECVFVSEWDTHARKTYQHNFKSVSPHVFAVDETTGEQKYFAGDITKVDLKADANAIPDFDVLCGGFPCQPFSQAGLKKGMEETRGTLFFDIVRILEEKKPAAFFLENVRGLLNHQSGEKRTIEIIEQKLTELGYSFNLHLVKASDFGVPQHRPRLFIIGFKSEAQDAIYKANLPTPVPLKKTMSDIMGGEVNREVGFTLRVGGRHSGVHDRRNWDTYLVDGVPQVLNRLQGLEMQGFPEWFEFPHEITETQAMKQLGNSVAVPAIEAYAKAIMKALRG
jgi:DNA (cytosine-5)-methyltransferase 1